MQGILFLLDTFSGGSQISFILVILALVIGSNLTAGLIILWRALQMTLWNPSLELTLWRYNFYYAMDFYNAMALINEPRYHINKSIIWFFWMSQKQECENQEIN